METTIFFNFQERNGNHELVKVLNAIKEGKFKTEIAKLRNTASEEDRRSIKNALPAFTPSVVLNSGRKFNEGDSYNGVIHLDYDKLDDVTGAIDKIKSLEYTYSCFVSPSGNGIKVFVRVSNKMEQHKDAFNTLRSLVMILAREGPHIGAWQWALVNNVPALASLSILGVCARIEPSIQFT